MTRASRPTGPAVKNGRPTGLGGSSAVVRVKVDGNLGVRSCAVGADRGEPDAGAYGKLRPSIVAFRRRTGARSQTARRTRSQAIELGSRQLTPR